MTPGSTRQEREWNRRHREILEAATDLFTTCGYAGTTMQMIADTAEFSVGYIYKHFPGKKELLDTIAETQIAEVERIRREVRADPDLGPLAKLRREIEMICRHFAQRPGLITLFMTGETDSPLLIKDRLDEHREGDALLFAEALAQEEIRPCDPMLTAVVYTGVAYGLLKLMSESGRPERIVEIPGIVEDLVLAPLSRTDASVTGGDRGLR